MGKRERILRGPRAHIALWCESDPAYLNKILMAAGLTVANANILGAMRKSPLKFRAFGEMIVWQHFLLHKYSKFLI